MERWVNRELDKEFHVGVDESFGGTRSVATVVSVAGWHHGMRPLRPEPGGRGKHQRGNRPKRDSLHRAMADARRIPELWRKHYGRKNRSRGEITAEEIAARRWGINEETLRKALKTRNG